MGYQSFPEPSELKKRFSAFLSHLGRPEASTPNIKHLLKFLPKIRGMSLQAGRTTHRSQSPSVVLSSLDGAI
jgi:hypothetical protein